VDIGQVHKDLNLTAAQLAGVFQFAPVPMAVVLRPDQGQLRFAGINDALLALLDQGSGSDRQAQADHFSLNPEDTRVLDDALSSLNGQAPPAAPPCQCQISLQLDGGRSVLCQVTLTAIPGSKPPAFIMLAEDIAARKEVEIHKLEAAAVEQREDFIATLTHDLKTPIVGANMVLTALLEGSLGAMSEQQAEIIGKLRTSNQALLKMIHNLLEVYKYESGHASLALSVVDLVAVIKFCVEDVKPLIENKAQSLIADLPAPELPIVCDQYAIQRVLVNLLGNAIKFTPSNGTITIKLEDHAEHILILVTDTGSGINPRDQHRLFQRFWQGEPGKRYAAGTGLGLYFCSHVVRAHDGTLTCQSVPGSGSTFTVLLPKNSAPSARLSTIGQPD
jgi:signal transduction histidine kinase